MPRVPQEPTSLWCRHAGDCHVCRDWLHGGHHWSLNTGALLQATSAMSSVRAQLLSTHPPARSSPGNASLLWSPSPLMLHTSNSQPQGPPSHHSPVALMCINP